MTSAAAHELESMVRTASEDTPYAVTTTECGFDVGVTLADATWHGLLSKSGLRRTFVHHVRLHDGGRYSITDEAREVRWTAGVPRIAASTQRQAGRIIARRFERSWAVGEDGQVNRVVDYRLDSEEGRALVTAAAQQLGLVSRRGTVERIGLVLGLIGAVGALIAAVVLLVAFFAGAL